MKSFRILLMFIFISSFGFSQDIIVTNQGDTLNCEITNIKDGYIYYSIIDNDVTKQSLVSINDVDYYFKGTPRKMRKERADFLLDTVKLEFGLNIGGAYRTGKFSNYLNSDVSDYHKKLKLGFYFSGSVAYYVNDIFGIGLKYSLNRASGDLNGATEVDTSGVFHTGNISENISVSYFGVYLNLRFGNDPHKLFFNAGVGKLMYKNDYDFIGNIVGVSESLTFSGSTIGFHLDLGYDYRLSRNISIGAKVSYDIGTINNVKYTNPSIFQPLYRRTSENLNNINFSVGVKFLLS